MQSQSGFQNNLGPEPRFLNRSGINLLKTNSLSICRSHFVDVPAALGAGKGNFIEKCFHNVPTAFQASGFSVTLQAGT
jgi:hypothetical protein